MNTITAESFLRSLNEGLCAFKDVEVVGDVDLGDLVLDKLVLDHVTFRGKVEGFITIGEIYIRSPLCWYWSNIRPLCYCGSMIEDLVS